MHKFKEPYRRTITTVWTKRVPSFSWFTHVLKCKTVLIARFVLSP
jgi:hypothetical protein